jgi:uncharacterized membrane protein
MKKYTSESNYQQRYQPVSLMREWGMNKATWHKQGKIWRSRLYLYPEPQPFAHTILFWIALGLVTTMAILFSAYFIAFMTTKQDALQTSAEDLGIMDQAVWSVMHGQWLHQTICNIVSDTNCYSTTGISRLAIHFEPILFPISLFYAILPSPKTLMVVQTLVVASGAFPAFWLARLRLRNELVAAAMALIYLLYPAQQAATVFDFHAVTLTASLLLFTLYFMYTRRTVWLFVFAVLAMACKEEIPLVIAIFGIWSIIFQQRWRSGLGLLLLSLGWIGCIFLVYHLFSPTGHSLLASRYAYLGQNTVDIARTILLHPFSLLSQHVLEQNHRQYLRLLLAPVGYLPLLAPWILVLAIPSIAINLLSTDPNQYLGIFQYNAEIVPVLIFATIEAIVVIIWAFERCISSLREQNPQGLAQPGNRLTTARNLERWLSSACLFILMGGILFNMVRHDRVHGALPITAGFQWPQVVPHDILAQRFIERIPASASVSAQTNLVPQISERSAIYLFPYGDDRADYIFLDITSSPYPSQSTSYMSAVKKVLMSGKYGVVAAQDGFLLLQRGLPPPGISPFSPIQKGDDVVPDLPDSFCSFVNVYQWQVLHPIQVNFSSHTRSMTGISLVGYDVVAPASFKSLPSHMQVTTYWRVNTIGLPPLRVLMLLTDKNGKEQYVSADFPALSWCPSSTWKPGTIVRLTSSNLDISNVPHGLAHVAIALLPFVTSFSTSTLVTDRLSFQIVRATSTVRPIEEIHALQLNTLTLSP